MKVGITAKIIYDLEVKPIVNNGMLSYVKTKRMIDPIDEASIAAVVKFKEIVSSIIITVICLSKESDNNLFKYILSMGVDEVIYVKTVSCNDLIIDGLTRAKILKRLVVVEKHDLVITGKSSSDNNSGFIGPALATFLGWCQLYYVCELVDKSINQLTVRCKLQNRIMTFITKLPCVLVCEFNKSERYISMFDLIRSKNKKIRIKVLNKLNLICSSCISVVNYVISNKIRKKKALDSVNTLMTTLFN
ncbi:Electron transfer flavoprotein small subunit [Candidatus Hodgkinia cicadicola]|uniref:Electron transfer flavoprotein small subunit n=1 Tax=Candidatus Hodgkinia cicadicola TaxID=573658 RepID=A0ABX4MFV5_9HYPH|nr:Electron transfer flavoprotein small subunit [Candidatus Hodgkinia cicadicola]